MVQPGRQISPNKSTVSTRGIQTPGRTPSRLVWSGLELGSSPRTLRLAGLLLLPPPPPWRENQDLFHFCTRLIKGVVAWFLESEENALFLSPPPSVFSLKDSILFMNLRAS